MSCVSLVVKLATTLPYYESMMARCFGISVFSIPIMIYDSQPFIPTKPKRRSLHFRSQFLWQYRRVMSPRFVQPHSYRRRYRSCIYISRVVSHLGLLSPQRRMESDLRYCCCNFMLDWNCLDHSPRPSFSHPRNHCLDMIWRGTPMHRLLPHPSF